MTSRERLHQIVDQLPEATVEEAERLLESLKNPLESEDRAWLGSDLSGLGLNEPYDWRTAGPPEGRPVRYVPRIGFVVED